MKTIVPDIRKMLYGSQALMLTAALLSGELSYAGRPPQETVLRSNGDSIIIFKQAVKRSDRISLYPDANQKVIFFSVKGDEGKAYQLFVFDMDGNMVKQAEIRNKQTTPIKGIVKGVYLFEVFSDDNRIGNGRIAVR